MDTALGSFLICKCFLHKRSPNKLFQADSTQRFMLKKGTPIKGMEEETNRRSINGHSNISTVINPESSDERLPILSSGNTQRIVLRAQHIILPLFKMKADDRVKEKQSVLNSHKQSYRQ